MNSPQTNSATLSTLRSQHLAPREAALPAVSLGFGSLQSFELMQRAAKLLSSSTLVPAQYRAFDEKKGTNNPNALANCVVALNMSQRAGADPLMVMQNLYVVEGRPSWSSQWIIAAINGCGRFSPLRFEIKDLGEKDVEYEVTKWVDHQRVASKHKAKVRNLECVAWALEKETGERVTSPSVSIEMAVKEGWYGKSGSKWQTMPEVMLRYRTASFFGRLYAPELLMGLQTVEEIRDVVIDADFGDGHTVDLESLKAAKDSVPPSSPDNPLADPKTGEIQDATTPVPDDPDDKALRQIEQSGRQKPAIGFEDAIAAIESGDFDIARDIARSLPDRQKKAIESAIANKQQAQASADGNRPKRHERGQRQGFNLE
ncbi:MAG: recombinase RecT [Azoarcus sp.]|jgi:hypothetical protein|nr:recombinase RecT [Azoarcus sp.]